MVTFLKLSKLRQTNWNEYMSIEIHVVNDWYPMYLQEKSHIYLLLNSRYSSQYVEKLVYAILTVLRVEHAWHLICNVHYVFLSVNA